MSILLKRNLADDVLAAEVASGKMGTNVQSRSYHRTNADLPQCSNFQSCEMINCNTQINNIYTVNALSSSSSSIIHC